MDDFWTRRPELTTIFETARAQRVSPWAVLGTTLARVVATVPPWITLPAIVGTEASLNLFVAVAGPPGAGKSSSLGVSRNVLRLTIEPDELALGSGEGVSAAYVKWVKRKGEEPEIEHIRDSVLFSAPEISTVTALKSRTGSTLMDTLRRAWSGETLGFQNRAIETRLPVERHSYRLCLFIGVQPDTAETLLSSTEFGVGTAQRFVWFSALDPNAPDFAPDPPPPIHWERPAPPNSGAKTITMSVAGSIVAKIQADHLPVLQGKADAEEAHENLTQLKVAAAFAVLDQRWNVSEGDWQLSEVVMKHSSDLRDSLILHAKAERTKRTRGQTWAQIDANETVMRDRVEKRVMSILDAGPVNRRTLTQRLSRPQREYLDMVLADLVDSGAVITEGDSWRKS